MHALIVFSSLVDVAVSRDSSINVATCASTAGGAVVAEVQALVV